MIVPGREAVDTTPGAGRAEPRLHTDPQEPSEPTPRRVDIKAVLGGIAIAVVLAALVLFTFMTSTP